MKYNHLSVYFDEERIYTTLLSRASKGIEVIDVNVTEHPYSFMNIDEDANELAKSELHQILDEYEPTEIQRISISLPTDNILISQFPTHPNISDEELKNLVNFEIKNSYPQFSYEDFNSNVYQIKPTDSKYMLLAVIISKKDLELCKDMLARTNKPIDNIEISQFNAHNAYIYNYPDKNWKRVAFFNLSSNFIDFTILDGNELLHYSIIATSTEPEIGLILDEALMNASTRYKVDIDAVFLFGSKLNIFILEETKKLLSLKSIECNRLNAFRMMESRLSTRKKEYCSRMAHVFSPCIGGYFQSLHKKFKFY